MCQQKNYSYKIFLKGQKLIYFSDTLPKGEFFFKLNGRKNAQKSFKESVLILNHLAIFNRWEWMRMGKHIFNFFFLQEYKQRKKIMHSGLSLYKYLRFNIFSFPLSPPRPSVYFFHWPLFTVRSAAPQTTLQPLVEIRTGEGWSWIMEILYDNYQTRFEI